jgi:hypothetical protein
MIIELAPWNRLKSRCEFAARAGCPTSATIGHHGRAEATLRPVRCSGAAVGDGHGGRRWLADAWLQPYDAHDQPAGRARSSGRLRGGAGDRRRRSRSTGAGDRAWPGVDRRPGLARGGGRRSAGCGGDPTGSGVGPGDCRAPAGYDGGDARVDRRGPRARIVVEASRWLGRLRAGFVRVWCS